jgi:hypothetical protein
MVVRKWLIVLVAKEGFGRHVWDLADGGLLHILKSCKVTCFATQTPLTRG